MIDFFTDPPVPWSWHLVNEKSFTTIPSGCKVMIVDPGVNGLIGKSEYYHTSRTTNRHYHQDR